MDGDLQDRHGACHSDLGVAMGSRFHRHDEILIAYTHRGDLHGERGDPKEAIQLDDPPLL